MPQFSDVSIHLGQQAIELPSWAFGNSGTRFRVFGTPGTARNPFEKIRTLRRCISTPVLRPLWPCTSRRDKVESYGDFKSAPRTTA